MKPRRGIGQLIAADGDPKSAFLGTCFSLADKQMAVTASHCLGALTPQQIAVRFPFIRDEPVVSVLALDRHVVAEVARLLLDTPPGVELEPYSGITRVFHQGQPVVALGFTDDARVESDIAYDLRYFAGNVQRWCRHGRIGKDFRALEVSFPSPAGLSGGPLFTGQDHVEVVGVMCGNAESYTQQYELEEAEEDGHRYREIRHRVVEYGIAADLHDIANWVCRSW